MQINVTNIPEFSFLPEWIVNEPEEFGKIVGLYTDIISKILNISDEEIERILEARQLMKESNIKLHSASKLNTAIFLKVLKNNISEKKKQVEELFSFNSIDSGVVQSNLQTMLENGSKIAISQPDAQPIDGDTTWDRVIWGHTQARKDIDKKILVHFLLSHYTCQYMNYVLGEDFFLNEKDDFINILGDLILFDEATKGETELYKVWSTTKEDGGLGWLDNTQLDIYNRVV